MAVTSVKGWASPSSGARKAAVGCGVKTGHSQVPTYVGTQVGCCGGLSLSLRKPVWAETKGSLAEKAHLEGGGEVKDMNSGVKLSGFQSHSPHSLAV